MGVRRRAVRTVPANDAGRFATALRCSRNGGEPQTRFAQTARLADPRFTALLGGLDVRPSAYRPPPWTGGCCIQGPRYNRRGLPAAHSTPQARHAVRVGDPLCAAEERSVSRIRARDCLSTTKWSEFGRDPAKREHRKGARRAGVPGSHGPYRVPGARPWDECIITPALARSGPGALPCAPAFVQTSTPAPPLPSRSTARSWPACRPRSHRAWPTGRARAPRAR